jgi:hypothetical protein
MHTTIFAATPEALRDEVVRDLERMAANADTAAENAMRWFSDAGVHCAVAAAMRKAAEYWREVKIEPPKESGNG